MRAHPLALGLTAALSMVLVTGCDRSPVAPDDALDAARDDALRAHPRANSDKKLDPAVCALDQSFTLASTNPYFPLTPGSFWLLEGEEDGTAARVRIDVTNDTEEVGGVTTRVLTETEWEFDEDEGEFELIEISYNFFALTPTGTVCYFGEAVDIFEDGELVSHEGEWRADDEGSAPGIFMPADPRPGMRFQIERAPGVAEDEGRIVGVGPVRVPAGTFRETIRVREFNPLDRGKGYKVFAAGVGTIIDGPLALVEYSVAP